MTDELILWQLLKCLGTIYLYHSNSVYRRTPGPRKVTARFAQGDNLVWTLKTRCSHPKRCRIYIYIRMNQPLVRFTPREIIKYKIMAASVDKSPWLSDSGKAMTTNGCQLGRSSRSRDCHVRFASKVVNLSHPSSFDFTNATTNC